MFSNIEIGNRICDTRTAAGLTLEEVASAVGVAKSTIMRYEKGTIEKIKLPIIESIARVLDVDPNWLIGNVEQPSFSHDRFDLTRSERTLLLSFRSLNDKGQSQVLSFVNALIQSGVYLSTEGGR